MKFDSKSAKNYVRELQLQNIHFYSEGFGNSSPLVRAVFLVYKSCFPALKRCEKTLSLDISGGILWQNRTVIPWCPQCNYRSCGSNRVILIPKSDQPNRDLGVFWMTHDPTTPQLRQDRYGDPQYRFTILFTNNATQRRFAPRFLKEGT